MGYDPKLRNRTAKKAEKARDLPGTGKLQGGMTYTGPTQMTLIGYLL